jgi:hypothetical protein
VEEKHDVNFKEEMYKQQINYTPFQTGTKNCKRKSIF